MLTGLPINTFMEYMSHYVSPSFLGKNPHDFISFQFQPQFFLRAVVMGTNKTHVVTDFRESTIEWGKETLK